MEYKGYKYRIIFCDPSNGWKDKAGKFHIEIAMGDSSFYDTYAEADKTAKQIIDDFIENVPQSKNEWLDAMSNCMVWHGYEDCELDNDMVWALLKKASKYLRCE